MSQVVETKPTSPKILTSWPFTENVCDLLKIMGINGQYFQDTVAELVLPQSLSILMSLISRFKFLGEKVRRTKLGSHAQTLLRGGLVP